MVLDDVRLTADQRRSAVLAAARHELHKHLPSKQALFAAVLRDATHSMREMVAALMAAGGGAMTGTLAVAGRATSDPPMIETLRLRTLAPGLVDDTQVRAALGEFVAVAEPLCRMFRPHRASGEETP
jgi:AcrR family transcriptional regulator